MTRSAKHLKFVRKFPCVCCFSRTDVQAAHIRIGTGGGMGLKPNDCWTVPLCAKCHLLQHTKGERTFWEDALSYDGVSKAKDIATWLAAISPYVEEL